MTPPSMKEPCTNVTNNPSASSTLSDCSSSSFLNFLDSDGHIYDMPVLKESSTNAPLSEFTDKSNLCSPFLSGNEFQQLCKVKPANNTHLNSSSRSVESQEDTNLDDNVSLTELANEYLSVNKPILPLSESISIFNNSTEIEDNYLKYLVLHNEDCKSNIPSTCTELTNPLHEKHLLPNTSGFQQSPPDTVLNKSEHTTTSPAMDALWLNTLLSSEDMSAPDVHWECPLLISEKLNRQDCTGISSPKQETFISIPATKGLNDILSNNENSTFLSQATAGWLEDNDQKSDKRKDSVIGSNNDEQFNSNDQTFGMILKGESKHEISGNKGSCSSDISKAWFVNEFSDGQMFSLSTKANSGNDSTCVQGYLTADGLKCTDCQYSITGCENQSFMRQDASCDPSKDFSSGGLSAWLNSDDDDDEDGRKDDVINLIPLKKAFRAENYDDYDSESSSVCSMHDQERKSDEENEFWNIDLEEGTSIELAASPSSFSRILCTRFYPVNTSAICRVLQAISQAVDIQRQTFTSYFDFSTPSPDDVVRKKRKHLTGGRRRMSDNIKAQVPIVKEITENELISDLCGHMVFGPDCQREGVKDVPSVVSNENNTTSNNVSNKTDLTSKEEESILVKSDSPEKSLQEDQDLSSSQAKEMKTSFAITMPQPTKGKSIGTDALASYQKQRGSSKPLINLVVIGHVDAGKSTLMGHLLYKLGCVSKKLLHRYEQDSKKVGKASFMYAWVLDETSEERTRGITMDVAQSKFETPKRTVTLLDAPGHKDFIPNMITGAAQADVALLVVDATRGEFETGFEAGGQTREHTLLIRSLGVSQLAVVVNKLDNVAWLQDRYETIKNRLGAFLKQAGFRDSDVMFVPCSGLTGENLTERSKNPELQKWYDGPCLLEVIDNFKSPERLISKPFRMCISDVFKGMGSGFCVSGKIESGSVQTGEKRLVMPSGESCIVKGVLLDETSVPEAFAGDHVTLNISGLDMANVTAGSVLCDPNSPIPVTNAFHARVVIFNIGVPITKGFPVVLHYQSLTEQAVVKKLISQLNKSTGEVIRKKPRCLTKNSSGIIQLEVSKPICVELYKDYRDLGRFMLRSGGTTIAAGLIVEIL